MSKRRLLLSSTLAFIVSVACFGCSSDTEGSRAHSPTSTVQATLPPQNVMTLEKLNSHKTSDYLVALTPSLRENAEVHASLQARNVTVEILPDTLKVYDLYATIDAQLTGDVTKRVTYYLQPSDGEWRIANLKKE